MLKRLFKISFKILLILILCFTIAEIVLRLTAININNELFTEIPHNTNLLVLNKAFARLPASNIKKIKDKDDIRIFVVGETIHSQVPINPNGSFSHLLNLLLQHSFPDKNIELVSITLDKLRSFDPYDFSSQLVKYAPDIVMIYPGRDKLGYPFFAQDKSWLNRSVSKLHIYLLAKNLYGIFDNKIKDTVIADNQPLSNSLVSFDNNLNVMVEALQEHGVSVVLMNSSSNILDGPPQKSYFSVPDSARLKVLFENGRKAYLNHDYDKAYSYFFEVNKRDKAHAGTYYYLGGLAYQAGDFKTARKLLQQAVEHDISKVPSAFQINGIILKTATLHDVPLVNLENSFSRNSRGGIPGSNLFNDVWQANLYGNLLMAEESYKIVIKEARLKPEKIPLKKDFVLTPFDSAYDRLCSKEKEYIECPIAYSTFEETTVSLFANNNVSWEETMNKLYDYYITNKNYDLAFRIIANLALENPYDISINNKASVTASFLGDSQLVVHYAKKIYKLKPDVKVAQRIFLNYLKLDMPDKALPYIEYAQNNTFGGDDLRLIYDATRQVINLKKYLKKYPDNKDIRKQIAHQYFKMGNEEIALLYAETSEKHLRAF